MVGHNEAEIDFCDEAIDVCVNKRIEKRPEPKTALRRLIKIAQGDTHQSRIVANFLLAWWNSDTCGAFKLTEIWSVDLQIAEDMISVFELFAFSREYPHAYGPRSEFEDLIRAWRPKLVKKRKRE